MSDKSEEWTPYGLEAIRQSYLRRRRILGALIILGILLLSLGTFQSQTKTSISIAVNGEEVGNGIEIDAGKEEAPKKYVSVTLTPGQVSRLETGSGAAPAQVTQNSVQGESRAAPLPWRLWLMQFAPWLLAGAALYFLVKRRGKHDEINYGIYKGAMPLEMLTAQHESAVFTRRWAKASVFGKGRGDHLPAEVERITQEDG